MKRTILILAANPQDSARLRLDREVREIQERLQGSRYRNRFKLEQRWAVQPRNVQEAILEVKPQIVHFSGHGEGEAGLVFQDRAGQMKLVSSEALSGLFKLCADRVECVLMNACYSEAQAEAIVRHISYVIGMRQAVRDDAAIAFSMGFYAGLGEGLSFEDAFEQGKQEIQAMFSGSGLERKLVALHPVEDIPPAIPPAIAPAIVPDHLIPILIRKRTL